MTLTGWKMLTAGLSPACAIPIPKPKIVLLTGPMMTGRALKDVKRALDTITAERRQAGDAEVYRFDLSPQTGALGYGAGWHPSMRQQQKTANELTAYLKVLMGW